MASARVIGGPGGEYRRDIDGLRAVAVLSVLFAHAAIPGFSGGFVGVDIFFVISGYLITGLVMARIEAGTFSLVDFFERRTSRLLPALVVVLLAVAALGYAILTPRELKMLGQDLTATALFSMNFHGWSTGGYFGQDASTRILLHAWSLAVEEQFYLLFPVGLWLGWAILRQRSAQTARTGLAVAVAAMVVLSFALQQYLTQWPTTAAFYLLPPRMWELGAGALLALLVRQGAVSPVRPRVAAAAGVFALALIAWPVASYGKHTVFPGFTAAPPVLGAVLLIWAGTAAPANPVSRLLSLPIMVGIGLISYSLYLWHWPVLAFARLWTGRSLTLAEAAGLLALSALLAWASWWMVEQPLRRRGPNAAIGRRLVLALLALVPVVVIGQTYVHTAGMPHRVNEAVLQTDREGRAAADLLDCAKEAGKGCRFAAQGPRQGTVALWGDSHAGHFSPAVALALNKYGYDVVRYSSRSCPPLPGVSLSILQEGGPIGRECMAFNQTMPARLAAIDDLKLVILAGRWTSFLSADWKDAEDRWLQSASGAKLETQQAVMAMRSGILRAAAQPTARKVPVMVIDQAAEFPLSPRNCVARARMLGRDPGICRESSDITSAERQSLHQMLDGLDGATPLVSVFHAERAMCTAASCDPAPDGKLLYRDAHHLGVAGAQHFIPLLEPVLLQALAHGE